MINILLYQTLAFEIHGKIYKKSYKNDKLKISSLTWNEEFALPDESDSVSDIQDYFEYILKKPGEKTDNPSTIIYVNKIENRIDMIISQNFNA